MIRALDFIKDWRCFKMGDRFEFRPGVNLLVGDQGCGKSSLLKAIQKGGTKPKGLDTEKEVRSSVLLEASPIKMYKFDFEKDNPRTQSYFGDNIQFQVASMWSSHGESTRVLLRALDTAASCLCLMDEPDMALSIRSCNMLVKTFKDLVDRSSQVIAAVHNKTVIEQFEEVYSLEHRKWMTSAEFIETQADPTEFVPIKKEKTPKKKSVTGEKSPTQVIQEL
jgi:predicted ATPase